MNAIQKVVLTITATIIVAADAHAGRWLSRDPIQDGAGFIQRDPMSELDFAQTQQRNEPNLYAYVINDPINGIDPLGLVTVGFYGADTWFTFPNEGNMKMKEIADEVHAPIYRSLDILDPYKYLLNYFRNSPCAKDEPIKIFGHSWGGISAVKLSRWIGRSELRNHQVIVAVIDPVPTLRLPPTSVPSNVTFFWNRYQTAGTGVYIPGYGAVHGRSLTSYAQSSDQVDLNPSDPNGLDHFSIIDAVRDQVIELMKQPW